MPGAKKNFIGLEGFIWWIGVVEDRKDPEQLGRVRVRCFGWHTEDKNKIPTDALPWAHPVIPVNNPSTYTPKEGDMVFGFFMDGDSAQRPAIMGVLPGKPDKKPNYQNGFSDPRTDFGSVPNKPNDSAEPYPKGKYIKEQTTNRLARGKSDSTVIATRKKNRKTGVVSAGGVTWDEPLPAFNPTYPYNNALETESGHALEFDDTKGQERVHLAHRMGSFFEIDKDGNKVEKVVKDNYELIMGADYVYISGTCSVTIGGDCNLKVAGKINAEAEEININASGDINVKAGGAFKVESGSSFDVKSGDILNLEGSGAVNVKGGGSIALTGSSVEITSPLNVSGATNLTVSGSTELASGSGPHKHVITQQPVSGSGASAAGTASETGLGEVSELAADTVAPTTSAAKIFSSTGFTPSTIADIPTNAAAAITSIGSGLSIAKSVSGVTSTVNDTFSAIKNGADAVTAAINSKLPFVQLQDKVSTFEFTVNNLKGDILSLPDNLKGVLTNKITQVVDTVRSYPQTLEFSVNDTLEALRTQVNAAKGLIETTKRVLGKRTYPSTETIEVPADNTDILGANSDIITANTESSDGSEYDQSPNNPSN